MKEKRKKTGHQGKKRTSETVTAKNKLKQKSPALVVAKSDDLRDAVTETVTKLLAEDVLDMNDEGVIDLKKSVEFKKKKKDKKSK